MKLSNIGWTKKKIYIISILKKKELMEYRICLPNSLRPLNVEFYFILTSILNVNYYVLYINYFIFRHLTKHDMVWYDMICFFHALIGEAKSIKLKKPLWINNSLAVVFNKYTNKSFNSFIKFFKIPRGYCVHTGWASF